MWSETDFLPSDITTDLTIYTNALKRSNYPLHTRILINHIIREPMTRYTELYLRSKPWENQHEIKTLQRNGHLGMIGGSGGYLEQVKFSELGLDSYSHHPEFCQLLCFTSSWTKYVSTCLTEKFIKQNAIINWNEKLFHQFSHKYPRKAV